MAQPIILVGAGNMGGALLKGWCEAGIGPILAVEPAPSPGLAALAKTRHIALFAHTASIDSIAARACVVALKPQILKIAAAGLAPIAQSGALMISIAAGATTQGLRAAWGAETRLIRAMPNTPGSIGRGITALFAAKGATGKDKTLADTLLSALGRTVWVKAERDIDAVTAVSGSGPAYIFLLVEALAAAAEAEGLPRQLAETLARATVAGSGALLDADPAPAATLRRNVTSPGGTTQAALDILLAKDGLAPLMRRAIAAARKRAEELGS